MCTCIAPLGTIKMTIFSFVMILKNTHMFTVFVSHKNDIIVILSQNPTATIYPYNPFLEAASLKAGIFSVRLVSHCSTEDDRRCCQGDDVTLPFLHLVFHPSRSFLLEMWLCSKAAQTREVKGLWCSVGRGKPPYIEKLITSTENTCTSHLRFL